MLRLRQSLLSQILLSPSTCPISRLRRLISAAVPTVSPNPSFAVEDYLISICGLTRPQALKASAKLSHLNSPSNPDAVLAFLPGLGLFGADVAALVAKDPQLLCTRVETTLAPAVIELTGVGLSRFEIAPLVSLTSQYFRRRSVASRLLYFLSLFGSHENLLRVLKYPSLLGCDLDKVVKPNVSFLRESGLGDCDITKLCIRVPCMLSNNPERVRAIVACAEGIGVPRRSGMLMKALQVVAILSQEKITAEVEHLKKTFRWSDDEVGIAVSKAPTVLMKSKESLHHRSEFLISKVGLEPAYIACRPAILTYSLEGRLKPRYYVVKFLKENGLLDHNRDYYAAVMISEKAFVDKFVRPHKHAAPHLADDYAKACRGEVPARA
ncbi:hypothetical protein CFC21_026937 [Triticum aestivum]|uniref:Uncharacterized protein n=2 Tax=Triticum aestivum TaxID=4565 RepID=A0A9R1EMK5_WHEAT|nr:hypothetical protein CFC21_026937 [Triticum aestivum]